MKLDLHPWRARLENPQFLKRVRELVRGRRAFVVISIYTAILSLICFFVVASQMGSGVEASEAGRAVFVGIGFTQSILIGLLVLVSSIGALIVEHHSQCFPALVLTGMSPLRVLGGEILANMSFAAGLVAAGLPMMGLAFLLGGASLGEVASVELSCLVSALLMSALGLLISALSVGGNLITTVLRVLVALILLSIVVAGYLIWFLGYQSMIGVGRGPFFVSLGSLSFYGWKVPGEVAFLLFYVFLAATFLNVARRKFYDSSRRAFSPWGFFLTAGILLVLLAGSGTSPAPARVDDEVFQPVNILAGALLLFGVLFAAGDDRDETLNPSGQNPFARFVRRSRLHLLAFVLLVIIMNQHWWRLGAFDAIAEIRLLLYFLGVLAAAQGIVNALAPVVPNRRTLIHACFALFVIWSTVVPTGALVLMETYRHASDAVAIVGAFFAASAPGIGSIFALVPKEIPLARGGGPLSNVENWLWAAVLVFHAAIFFIGSLTGLALHHAGAGNPPRQASAPEPAPGS